MIDPALTPVTTWNSGRSPRLVQPANTPAPKAPSDPPPESARVSITFRPFIVYGLVRTAEVASKVPPGKIATSFALYLVLYAVLIVAYVSVVRYMAGKPPML